MILQEAFDQNTIDREFIGALLHLAVVTMAVADHFYDVHHQPKMDVTYRQGLPAFNALNWQPVSDRYDFLQVRELGDWLQSHDVTQTAHYAGGGSAAVYATRLKSDEIKMLRIGHGLGRRPFKKEDHMRLKVPQVLQPHASIDSLIAKSHSQSETVIELLPPVPVLPNDIAGFEIIPGHSVYHPTPIDRDIISADQWAQLERQKLILCSCFRSNGFDLSRVADIGLLPDGTPIFVDPDTLRQGGRRPEIASARVHNLIGAFMSRLGTDGRGLQCYEWLDEPIDYNDLMKTAKQHRFFPNPYAEHHTSSPAVSRSANNAWPGSAPARG